MNTVNATNFRKDLFKLLQQVSMYKDPLMVSTKEGNVILLSEDEYNSIMETMYLESIPGMKDKLIEGMNTPLSECVSEEEVEW